MIRLRNAQFSDYTAIAKLHSENWKEAYRGILSDHYLDYEVEKDRLDTWHQRLQSPASNQYITVALSNDVIVGFCCVFLNDDPDFGSLIDNLHVAPALRQSGIGKMLVKESARYVCEKADNKKMYLWVFEDNRNARIAYQAMGGTNVETVDKGNPDGTVSRTCRIFWSDASKFL
jgi:ribosomal protein S18 acetylase RimI-like enzyme